MNSKAILGISLAAVFAVSMMINPIWGPGDGLSYNAVDGFTMFTNGAPGQTTDGHDIVVYAFLTDTPGKAPTSFVAYVAAVHPTFSDDNEQKHDLTVVHGHALELDNDTLCVEGLAKNPTAKVKGESVTVNGGHGNIVASVIAGYDVTPDGICPTEVYDDGS